MTAVILDAARTPIGTAGRSLAEVDAASLAAPVLVRLAAGAPGGSEAVGEVVLGNCTGPGGDVARVAALAAGLQVPALTVDRQCASGLAAVVAAVTQVQHSGGVVLAGGVESASTSPWRYWPPAGDQPPVRYTRAPFAPAPADDPDMGLAADLLAEEAGISRAAQDDYAARSHARAACAQAAGRFDSEIVPVAGVSRDDRPRSGLTVARLGRLRPAYRPGGTVTAGTSCGVNDGAAGVTVVDEAASRGRRGLRVLATATAASAPARPGRALVPAVRLAVERAGVELGDVDVIEINEAFAGQVLACCAELDLDPERVCPEGGALALGHPWGASGAVLLVRLFAQLLRPADGSDARGRLGLAAIAAGGGQGVAMVVEAVG